MSDRPDPDNIEMSRAPLCVECHFRIVDEQPVFGVYGWCHSVCAATAIAVDSMKWGSE